MDQSEMLFDHFLENARVAPDTTFAIFSKGGQDKVISRGDVLCQATALMKILRANGVPRGSIIPIVLNHSEWLYSAFIGCVIGGYVPSILPPWNIKQDVALFQDGVKVLFERLTPVCVVTSRTTEASVPIAGIDKIYTEDIAPMVMSDALVIAETLERGRVGLAFLQHSSGTTGHKKGVCITHRQALDQLSVYSATIGIRSSDIVASWLPLYHDMGLVTSFLLPVMLGCPIISLDALEWVTRPGLLLDAMEKHDATYAWLPNFAFHHILRGDRSSKTRNLRRVKAIINCSEPCRAETFTLFADRYESVGLGREKLQVSYAMAENVFAISQTRIGEIVHAGASEATKNWLSCGQIIPGTELVIRDEKGEIVPDGTIGAIYVRGSYLFDGYYKQNEISTERIVDGWYSTGDLGCFEDDQLFVVGRTDDLLIVSGKNVLAHEIEDAISALPGITPGRVLACEEFDRSLGSRRLVVLVETAGQDIEQRALDDSIRNLVYSVSGVPAGIVEFLPRGFLVKSSSGKLARVASQNKWREHKAAPR